MRKIEIATVPNVITTKTGSVLETLPVSGLETTIIRDGKAYRLNIYNGGLQYERWDNSKSTGKKKVADEAK